MSAHLEHLNLKLGRKTNAGELDAVPRALSRREGAVYRGYDLWNAYEVSFLLPSGKPAVYHLQAIYPATSPNIVESKSFKLYLNSFNNRVFADVDAFSAHIKPELEACVGAEMELIFLGPDLGPTRRSLPGICLDVLDPATGAEHPDVGLLRRRESTRPFLLYSHLLRSNCPVTNQPDWGSVLISGRGPWEAEPVSLLTYLLSYRNHQGFHEACCEGIYSDLMDVLEADNLTVACFYTRRGGLDINPLRTTEKTWDIQPRPVWRQ